MTLFGYSLSARLSNSDKSKLKPHCFGELLLNYCSIVVLENSSSVYACYRDGLIQACQVTIVIANLTDKD